MTQEERDSLVKIFKFLFKVMICVIIFNNYDYIRYSLTDSKSSFNTALRTEQNGFVEMSPYIKYHPSTVVVIAPASCTRRIDYRAKNLIYKLIENGIPVTRWSGIALSQMDNTEQSQRIQSLINSEGPIVIVRGQGKSNPTLEEVIAVYDKPNSWESPGENFVKFLLTKIAVLENQ